MTYPIKHVVNCFLQKDFEDDAASITPMKMQKLIYYLHGWHLAITGEPLIAENFQAWQYGPVEEGLYHLLKGYGGNPITEYIKEWGSDWYKSYIVSTQDTNFYNIFNMVYHKYMPFSALQLSTMTHRTGTPWDEARKRGTPIIENSIIRQYFKELAHAEQ